MAKIGVVSLGCSKNQVDCEHMLCLLDEAGYELTTELNDVDAVLINTCGFIGDAREEAHEYIKEAVTLKNEGSVKKIIVTGCLAERDREKVKEEYPEVDALVGCGSYTDIVAVCDSVFGGEYTEVFGDVEAAELECGRILTTPQYTAFIKIAEGCSKNCSYCTIPSIRGKMRSRDFNEIINEARALSETGVRELIVIAQDTGCYGMDNYGKRRLAELLSEMAKISGLEWIRVHYLYPDGITDELLDVFCREEKIVNYFDIPIQHINDRILKLMHRTGNRAETEALINKIRSRLPDAVIRTSLIVGFPGETEEEFEELCDFLKEYKLPRAGVFPYFCEEGTAASKLDGQLDEEIKQHRAELVGALQSRIMDEYNKTRFGKTIKVLCEGFDRYSECYFGRSEADSPEVDGKVFFTGKKGIRPGTFVNVTAEDDLDGDIVGSAE